MKRESRLILLLAGASLVAAFAITAVYRTSALRAGGEKSRPKIAVILKTINYNLAFWQTLRDGIESASKDFDVDVTILGPVSETQVDDQILIIRNTLHDRPAAIVLAAADYNRLVPVAGEIKAMGIPLVTIDSFIKGKDTDARIGTDNYDAGQKAGATLMQYLNQGSPVVIMSYVQGSSTAIDRESGVRGFLQGKVRIKETLYSNGESDIAYLQALRLLRTAREVKGIVALNDPTTIGAARALRDSGRERDVVLIGFDNSLAVIGFVEAGIVRDTIVQRPFNMGYLGIRVALDLIRGQRVEPFIDTGSKVINRRNMLLPENQKLLFPVAR